MQTKIIFKIIFKKYIVFNNIFCSILIFFHMVCFLYISGHKKVCQNFVLVCGFLFFVFSRQGFIWKARLT